MNLIKRILSHKELRERPPVLVDIGASGAIHPRWKPLADKSICIAFDGDDREFGYNEVESKDFQKLFRFHSLVVDNENEKTEFFLTKSPYCSSTLEPDNDALKVWAFADKFIVEKKESIRSISLQKALAQVGLSYVDWFKSDSQGIDLRLFATLTDSIRKNILAVEFEPGIIDAYKNEDKLWEILRFMEKEQYWLSDGTIKGSQRFSKNELEMISGSPLMQKLFSLAHKESPGWIEMVYLHSFDGKRTLRDYLLGWVIATIQEQHGFALKLSIDGSKVFHEDLFEEMNAFSKKKITMNLFGRPLLSAIHGKIRKVLKLS